MSVLDKTISYYPSKNDTSRGIDTSLLIILKSNKHQQTILNLRASPEEIQKKIKENLPCYTVAGRFSHRHEKGIIELSGLAAVDLDSAEDYDIRLLLHELKKNPFIAYAGPSCRGKRLFCIISLLYPHKYSRQYERLIQSFNDYGLPMGDECHKAISQPRFVSWSDDDMHFFNHDPQPYPLLSSEKFFIHIRRKETCTNSSLSLLNRFTWCNEQINKKYQFIKGKRHNYIMHLARYCNIKGLSKQDTLNGCFSYVQEDFTNREIEDIVVHIYSTQTESHNKLPLNANRIL